MLPALALCLVAFKAFFTKSASQCAGRVRSLEFYRAASLRLDVYR